MRIYKSKRHLINHLSALKEQGTLGFVPTMGALHEGHMSLIERSKKECKQTICSIFVNPTQFNQQNDLINYPRPLENDLNMLAAMHCDVVFVPKVSAIYPKTQESSLEVELGKVGTILEGIHRPGHFEGVMQVVKILLDIVQPDKLFLGQKDYQQLMILKMMIEQLNIETEVVPCDIIREKDGLAMSSRNMLLTKNERLAAKKLNEALRDLKEAYSTKSDWKLSRNKLVKALNNDNHINVEYLELANANNLELLEDWHVKTEKRILIAAYVGKVRLIDNIAI